ncbi:MAG: serine hydrolase domain-containing protein [Chloroflexota bacterium]|nr:serine hydrolase domain-containing protein [Chloroflexota bacterium]
MKLVRVVCLLLLAALMVSGASMAQDDETFDDPNGQFTVPVPTNWTAEALDGYVLLQDPDELIQVYALAVEAETAEAGIEAAWAIVNPDFDQTVEKDIVSPPPPPGEDELLVITYSIGSEERIVQALARRIGEQVYVLIFDTDINAAMQRGAQLNIIASGFTPTAATETDLSEIEALALDDVILDELTQYTAGLLERLEVPGAAVAIVQDGEVIYTATFGVKELGSDDPIMVDTQFMIGSTGKSMTTMMMAALVDEGIIDWDTPVVDVLPDFAVADPELTQQITIRNLVCACTGVPRRDFELIFNADELTAEDIVASLSTFEFFTDFGEAFQYSNQMVATGGYAAAAAIDGEGDLFTSYLNAMQSYIYDPIGMPATTFDFDAVEARGNYAVPHGANLDAEYEPIPLSIETLLTPVAPAGASWSTVEDMANYLITLLSLGVAPDGTRIVSEENLLETWEAQVAVSADVSYGLGWFISEYKGVQVINHGGNTLGFTSDLALLPDAGLGIVVLSNGQAANMFNEGVRARLLELVYDQPAENEEQIAFLIEQAEATVEMLTESVGDAPSETDVEAFLGTYTNDVLGTVELRYEDGQFVADAGEFVVELRPNVGEDAEPDTYLTFGPPVPGLAVRFVDNDGVLQLVLGSAPLEYTFERVG